MKRGIVLAALCATLTGCGTPLWTEMLGESIKYFASKTKMNNEKVWVTGPADSACDSGCQSVCGGGKDKGGLGSLGGGLFGGGKSADGASSHDRLAFEVVSNYLTQKKKMRVIETHRHNYETELNVETHKKLEVMNEQGKTASSTSCEDLCMLDEAKKRKADKVLVYHIIDMSLDEMTIHYRLSDVPTGIVESSATVKVAGMRAFDASPASFQSRARGEAAAPAPQPEQ